MLLKEGRVDIRYWNHITAHMALVEVTKNLTGTQYVQSVEGEGQAAISTSNHPQSVVKSWGDEGWRYSLSLQYVIDPPDPPRRFYG